MDQSVSLKGVLGAGVDMKSRAFWGQVSDPADCPMSKDAPKIRAGRKGANSEARSESAAPRPPRKDAVDKYLDDVDRQEREELMEQVRERQERRDAAKAGGRGKDVNESDEDEQRDELFAPPKKAADKKAGGGKAVKEMDEDEMRNELFAPPKKAADKKAGGGKAVKEMDEDEMRDELFAPPKKAADKKADTMGRPNSGRSKLSESDRSSSDDSDGGGGGGGGERRPSASGPPSRKPPPQIEPAAGVGGRLSAGSRSGDDQEGAVRPFSPAVSPQRGAGPAGPVRRCPYLKVSLGRAGTLGVAPMSLAPV
jgi:hypothetical protein